MAVLSKELLGQKAVLWELADRDSQGDPEVYAATEIDCLWEDRREEEIEERQAPINVNAIVAVGQEINLGSIVRRGTIADVPMPADNLLEVIDREEIPDVKDDDIQRNMYLRRYGETLPTIVSGSATHVVATAGKAVLWAFADYDSQGDPEIYAAEEIDCRWEERQGERIEAESAPIGVDAFVYVNQEISIGSIIRKGSSDDLPSPIDQLMEVVDWENIYDLKSSDFSRVAFLKRYGETLPTIVSGSPTYPSFTVTSAVLWEFLDFDSQGNLEVAEPTEITVRWEDHRGQEIVATNSTFVVNAVSLVEQEIPLGSIVRRGTIAELPSPVDSLLEIVDRDETPDVKAGSFQRNIFLRRFGDTLPTVLLGRDVEQITQLYPTGVLGPVRS